MAQGDELRAEELRQQISRFQNEIATKTQTIEEQQSAEQFRQQAERMLSSQEMGQIYTPRSEMEALILTKVKLERDLREIEEKIRAEYPQETEVTGSARAIQEPPQELQNQQETGGVFSRIASWFRKTFSKKTPPEKPLSESLQARKFNLRSLEAQTAEYTADLAEQTDKAMAFAMSGQPAGFAIRMQYSEQNFQHWFQVFCEQKWTTHQNGMPPTKPAEAKTMFAGFLRELGSAGVVNDIAPDAPDDTTFQINEGDIPSAEVFALMSDRSLESFDKFLQPLYDFDVKQILEQYPLRECKGYDERVAMAREIYPIIHHLTGRVQLFEKFFKSSAPKEYLEKFTKAYDRYTYFASFLQGLTTPGATSPKEYIDETLLKQEQMAEFTAHAEEFAQKSEAMDERMRARSVMVPKERLKRCGFVSQSGFITNAALHSFQKTPSDTQLLVPIPEEELVQIERYSRPMAKQLIAELKTFSLVNEQGRSRVFGTEGAQEFLANCEEDMIYYQEMAEKADKLKMLLRPGSPLPNVFRKELPQIESLIERIYAVHDAVKSKMDKPAMSGADVKSLLRKGSDDPIWNERQQVEELEKYEKSH